MVDDMSGYCTDLAAMRLSRRPPVLNDAIFGFGSKN